MTPEELLDLLENGLRQELAAHAQFPETGEARARATKTLIEAGCRIAEARALLRQASDLMQQRLELSGTLAGITAFDPGKRP